ncbi:transmembrane protein, putative (macronuclear) [Tetrahymena thermophila SB210]|uniref:Transmembrane protein, putative n=1 Tax=Tetrahymena thermophila (strain SB210) TaxID=312017 RepID=W7XGG0_TETTS|nr:transmembrane protein, putative [Tetrahymena thermophila SB210]EWS76058.1 transmembrane protein, putative [Tetrahymena thermophila SB210]|eukprot:XP_012651409.1 transmembrane protein, putative [Tetrahymena thermophila SB210]
MRKRNQFVMNNDTKIDKSISEDDLIQLITYKQSKVLYGRLSGAFVIVNFPQFAQKLQVEQSIKNIEQPSNIQSSQLNLKTCKVQSKASAKTTFSLFVFFLRKSQKGPWSIQQQKSNANILYFNSFLIFQYFFRKATKLAIKIIIALIIIQGITTDCVYPTKSRTKRPKRQIQNSQRAKNVVKYLTFIDQAIVIIIDIIIQEAIIRICL